MNYSTTTVACPTCGRPATLTRVQNQDERGRAVKHELYFGCSVGDHVATQAQMLRMWAAHQGTARHTPRT